MLKHALAITIALALPVVPSAHAQNQKKVPDYKNVEQMLEQDFAPAQTRSLAPQGTAPAAVQKQEFEWVKPKPASELKAPPGAAAKTAPASPGVVLPLDKRSEATPAPKDEGTTWFSTIFSYFSAKKAEPMKAEPQKPAGPRPLHLRRPPGIRRPLPPIPGPGPRPNGRRLFPVQPVFVVVVGDRTVYAPRTPAPLPDR